MSKKMRPLAILLVLASSLAAAGPASAQGRSDAPTNLDCAAFSKLPNGNWHVGAETTVAIASNRMTLGNRDIARGQVVSKNGVDLYEVLERQCSKK